MTRVTKVGLAVDEQPYVRGIDKAAKATEKFADEVDDAKVSATELAAGAGKASETVEDLGDSARGAGRGLNGLRDDAAKLDRQIDETSRGIRELAREIARTSDEAARADLTKKLAGERRNLRSLTSLRGLLDLDPEKGEEQGRKFGARLGDGIASGVTGAGAGISEALGKVFGTLPPQAQAAIGASLIGVAAAAGPVIASTVAGAVTTGVAVAAVAGGIALASKDPRVQEAGKELGTVLSAGFTNASEPFVPQVLRAIDKIEDRFKDIQPEIRSIFATAASYVDPLTNAALGFVERLLPGLQAATAAAVPLIEVLEQHGPALGESVGKALTTLASTASESADTIDGVLTVTELGIQLVANSLKILQISLPPVAAGLLDLIGGTDDSAAAFKTFTPAAEEAAGGWVEFGGAALGAKSDLELARQAIEDTRNSLLEARSAERDMEAAIDDAAAAVKRDGEARHLRNGELDDNTAKGREYNDLLDDLATKTIAAAGATGRQTGSQEAANAVLERGRKKFLELADKMGMSKTAAEKLADAMFHIPSVSPKITVQNQQALNAIQQVTRAQGKLKDLHFGIYYTVKGDLKVPGGTQVKDRWGGINYAMAAGGTVEAHFASSPTVLYGERETGGEAFVPRIGNRQRSLDVLETAAGWYGKTLVSQPPVYATQGGAASPVIVTKQYNINVNVPPNADLAEAGRQTVYAIQQFERASGSGWRS